MKKVIVVSKTHLDLGFTDYAENIRKKYIDEFIPNAVKTAKSVNTDDCKKFVWTTGSWILKEALHYGNRNYHYSGFCIFVCPAGTHLSKNLEQKSRRRHQL